MALSDPFDTVARLMYDATSQFGKQGLALVEGLVEQKRKKDLLREEYKLKNEQETEKMKSLLEMIYPKKGSDGSYNISGDGTSPRLKSFKVGDFNFEVPQSDEEFKKELSRKSEEKDIEVQAKQKERESKMASEEESKYESGKSLLDEIKANWEKTSPQKAMAFLNPLGKNFGLLGIQPLYGVGQKIGSMLQLTKNQQRDREYTTFVNSLRSRLAKGTIGQDVGNLSEYEQRVVTEAVPNLTDTYEVGVGKIANTENVLKKMKDARLKGYKSLDEKLIKEGKKLSKEQAIEYLKKSGNNIEKARSMALQDGMVF